MEAIGSLTGGVAHEFNNLLMVIRGNLDLIATDIEPDGRLAGFVARALRGLDRGADLTQRLLSFARRHPVQPQICDINELVAGEIPILEQALGENGPSSSDTLRPRPSPKSIRVRSSRGSSIWC
jgi:signal transduction histidine kinase